MSASEHHDWLILVATIGAIFVELSRGSVQSEATMTTNWDAMQARRSPLKRGLFDSDPAAATSAAETPTSASVYSLDASPMKKINSGDDNATQSGPSPATTAAPAPPSMMDIRAYGLEDRAEAVIAHGATGGWSLANLAKWRRESLGGAQAAVGTALTKARTPSSSTAYLKQRQRAYRQRMLARGAPANSSTGNSPAPSQGP